jgi:signal peptidase I
LKVTNESQGPPLEETLGASYQSGMNGEGPDKLTWRTPRVRSKVLVFTIALAMTCYGFFTWVLWPVKVAGESMMPNYRDGSRQFINKLAYLSSDPKRGDVVALRLPNGDVLMKRIVGLPGETVTMWRGDLYINGLKLDEKYIESRIPLTVEERTHLGPGHYYVIGDNRATSVFTAITREQIVGKAVR